VKKLPPFLPDLSAKLQGRQKRRQLKILRAKRDEALASSISDLGVLFHDILPADWLAETAADLRKRLFPRVAVFWAWLSQVFEQNESCAKALALIEAWHKDNGLTPPSFDTSSYCKARQRLPDSFLDQIHQRVETFAEARVEDHQLWQGHRLKAIDGTSVKLMDTPENQAEFPQPSGQAKGCGFPVMGVVGVLDLARGTLSNFITCDHRQHDIRGFYQLRSHFQKGDIVIGDRAFCSYEMIALLKAGGVDSVLRLHQARDAKRDWKAGKRIDAAARKVVWIKPARRGKAGLSQEEWDALPAMLELRYVRAKGVGRDGKAKTIYLVTTLLDAKRYPSVEIDALYLDRWTIEVKIRDIKTTLKFEMLRVKTPAMARRTMKLVQLAYNLLKARQSEAVRSEPILLVDLGFKGTLDLVAAMRADFVGLAGRPRLRRAALMDFEHRLRQRVIELRPGRHEPRVMKTRPKPYPYLTQARHEFIEIPHRSRHRKTA
jgi:hypothetical protein